MSKDQIISTHFPFIPIYVRVRHRDAELEALLDTGFDGDIIVPPASISNGKEPDKYLPWRLANGSEIIAPAYLGMVRIGATVLTPVVVVALGNKPIVGTGILQHFRIILEHGDRVIVEI